MNVGIRLWEIWLYNIEEVDGFCDARNANYEIT